MATEGLAVNLSRLTAIVGSDKDLILQIADLFLDDARGRLRKLAAGVAATDADAVRREAHALKGASANIGADRFSAVTVEIEGHVKASGPAGLEPKVASLQEEFNAVESFFEQVKSGAIPVG